MKRLCVFCGSSKGKSAAFSAAARALGEELAARNIELVFGGSHVGLMGVVADAVLANGGRVTGVLPRFMDDKELAHPKLTKRLFENPRFGVPRLRGPAGSYDPDRVNAELQTQTFATQATSQTGSKLHIVETMHERKQLMAELAEGFIALPGGFGTLEEIFEAITWQQLHLHAHPCGLLNVEGYFDSLIEFLRGTVAGGFVRVRHLDKLIVAASPVDLLDRFAAFKPETSEKWIPSKLI